ncbi:hypothetical protein C8J57DRAFT_1389174 [Mycena rebaudengoi]|nr:hypothetical protein C8J57DRAFT_1389174 [Mycena rebaudengoi]
MAGRRLCRPGFGLPVNFKPNSGQYKAGLMYPNAVLDWCPDSMTVRERNMLELMNRLTDKTEWERKIFDERIVEKWRTEAVADPPQLTSWTRHTFTNKQGFTTRMFDFCVAELRDKAELYKKSKVVRVLDTAACVVKSDIAISGEFGKEISKAVTELLEDVPDHLKDWHPGSNQQVLDLVHPSLFPLVYGRTRILPDSTIGVDDCLADPRAGEVVLVPPASEGEENEYIQLMYPSKLWSTKFQWLPCDVGFSAGGGVKVASYVNNLHPVKHRTLYPLLEQVMSAAVPLWDEVLGFVGSDPDIKNYRRMPVDQANYEYDKNVREPGDGEDDWTPAQYAEEMDVNRTLILPDSPAYSEDDKKLSATSHQDHLRRLFETEGLQVIVKLANVMLTPEKPEYPGSSWHVEGQLNERICASAIYYYNSENVTDSYLAFRQKVDTYGPEDNAEGQDDFGGLEFLFDLTASTSAVQDIGRVKTPAGRLIAFPNVMQHRVTPFALQDRTKPGHRKIIALFLVDPHTRIISTANVPPQRGDWWADVREGDRDFVEGQDWPIGFEEANELREELMEERRAYAPAVEDAISGDEFNFCEH